MPLHACYSLEKNCVTGVILVGYVRNVATSCIIKLQKSIQQTSACQTPSIMTQIHAIHGVHLHCLHACMMSIPLTLYYKIQL